MRTLLIVFFLFSAFSARADFSVKSASIYQLDWTKNGLLVSFVDPADGQKYGANPADYNAQIPLLLSSMNGTAKLDLYIDNFSKISKITVRK